MEPAPLENPPTGAVASSLRDAQSQHRACDACKRRKVRCSGNTPCQHCSRNRARCSYTSASGKAVLMRLLHESQHRLQTLETAWKRFLPNIDLAYAIHVVETDSSQPMASGPQTTTVVPAVRSPTTLAIPSSWSVSEDRGGASSPPELEVDTAEALEWDETLDLGPITDGIGSLAVHYKASGYMGPQSGTALLRYLQSVGSFLSEESGEGDGFPSPQATFANASDLQAKLSSPGLRACCLDWYFKYYHKAYPLLHEGSFRAMFMGAIPKPKDGSWPVLLNTVLAVGALAGPESSTGLDTFLFREAHDALSLDLLQRGSLHLVQAFALMANYLQKRNKPNSGFTYLGIAINMALGLGLHREFSGKSISTFTMEVRRRVWWTLIIFDAGARLTFGRPSVSFYGANVKAPMNLDDGDIAVDVDQIGDPRTHPTSASSLIWQSKLAEISNLANAKLLQRRLPDQSEILSVNDQISAWYEELPSYFQDPLEADYLWFDVPRMVLRWRAQHLRIVIARPFLLDAIQHRRELDFSNANDAIRLCALAAQDCIHSIVNFYSTQDNYPGALVWYATYWLVTAVFVNITCLMYDPFHSSATSWRAQVEDSKQTLQKMSLIEPIADRALSILRSVMDLVPQSPSSTTITSNEQIRMGIADIWSESWLYDAHLIEGLDFNDVASDANQRPG